MRISSYNQRRRGKRLRSNSRNLVVALLCHLRTQRTDKWRSQHSSITLIATLEGSSSSTQSSKPYNLPTKSSQTPHSVPDTMQTESAQACFTATPRPPDQTCPQGLLLQTTPNLLHGPLHPLPRRPTSLLRQQARTDIRNIQTLRRQSHGLTQKEMMRRQRQTPSRHGSR